MIKTIWILWFQGFENAPQVVKTCLKSWKRYNSDWNIIELDENNLEKYRIRNWEPENSDKGINCDYKKDVITNLAPSQFKIWAKLLSIGMSSHIIFS